MKTVTIILMLSLSTVVSSLQSECYAQVRSSQKRTPTSRINQRVQRVNKLLFLTNEALRELKIQDSIDSQLGLPFRFGKNFAVDIDLIKEADMIKDGDTLIYLYEIKSPSAFSINLIFDDFKLNSNSSLSIYNNKGDFVYGPVTSELNPDNGIFWSDLVKGDHIVIELKELVTEVNEPNNIHISSVIHGYKNVFPTPNDYGDSFDCNNDIACPEGNDWRVEGNAVAMLLISDGTRFCSGSLVNNTANDFKAYLLTAFHCIDWSGDCSLSASEKAQPNNWLFRFHYESPSCDGIEGTNYLTINGANFRAAYQQTDFALLELSSTPTLATFAGWSRSSYAASIGIGIHHPVGDVKKISFDNDPLSSNSSQISWQGGCTSPSYTHWLVDYDDGTTQGGSSGSPLFDSNHRIVGQLHGGYNSCPPVTKYYGRFDVSWTGGGTNETRLSNWLDPLNTGANYLDTKISINSTLSGSTPICSSGTQFTINNLPANCSIYWTPGPNLELVSLQGSNPCVFESTGSGSSWVRATINSTNGIVTLPQYYVWSGVPILNTSGPSEGYTYNTYTFHANPPSYSNPYNYSWILNPQNNNNVYNYGSYADIAFYDSYEAYQVISRAENNCGLSEYSITNISIYESGGKFILSPNPASEVVTITSTRGGQLKSSTINIYSSDGVLKYKAIKFGDSFTIPVSTLQNGNYIVKISRDQHTESLHLIIKH